MKIQLIGQATIDVIKSSRPAVIERTYQRVTGSTRAQKIACKFYAITTAVEFDQEEATWLLFDEKKARIWKCELKHSDAETRRYEYECVTDTELRL